MKRHHACKVLGLLYLSHLEDGHSTKPSRCTSHGSEEKPSSLNASMGFFETSSSQTTTKVLGDFASLP